MRKIILGLAVTLDGFIEGPNGEYDWCFTDQDYGMSGFIKRIDAIFMGRKSYEMMASVESPEWADPWKGIKTYVFSNTLKAVPEGHQLVSGDVITETERIKSLPGKDIWLFGGAALTSTLLNAGLVDEIGMAVHPILLGEGKPLFSGIQRRIPMKLTDCKTYDTGLVYLTYEVPEI